MRQRAILPSVSKRAIPMTEGLLRNMPTMGCCGFGIMGKGEILWKKPRRILW